MSVTINQSLALTLYQTLTNSHGGVSLVILQCAQYLTTVGQHLLYTPPLYMTNVYF